MAGSSHEAAGYNKNKILTPEDDNMVGLSNRSWPFVDEKIEEKTAAPSCIPSSAEVCETCTNNIPYPNDKLIRDEKVTCIECYNKNYCEKEHEKPGTQLTHKQFQRKSMKEHKEAMQMMDPDMVSLSERAAKNPKRSPQEIDAGMQRLNESNEQTMKAGSDYLATIANGMSGFYACRSEGDVKDATILRVKPVQDQAPEGAANSGLFREAPEGAELQQKKKEKSKDNQWRKATREEIEMIKEKCTCSSWILPMHNWWRGGTKDKYRCPINFCEYHPYSERKGSAPSFYLSVLNEFGCRFFIPAIPPEGMTQNRVALLKLMFCEENLPALLGAENGVEHFWKYINKICESEHALLGNQCFGIEIKIKKPPFNIKESRASLNSKAIGRAVQCMVIPEEYLANGDDNYGIWGQQEWDDFLDAMFAHFRLDAMNKQVFNGLLPAQQKLLKIADQVTTGAPPHHPPPLPHPTPPLSPSPHPPPLSPPISPPHPPLLPHPPLPPPLPPPSPPPLPPLHRHPPLPPPPPVPPPTGAAPAMDTGAILKRLIAKFGHMTVDAAPFYEDIEKVDAVMTDMSAPVQNEDVEIEDITSDSDMD